MLSNERVVTGDIVEKIGVRKWRRMSDRHGTVRGGRILAAVVSADGSHLNE